MATSSSTTSSSTTISTKKVAFKSKMCQIFPCILASCMCVPFGLMLGWPCITYPNLLQPSSSIPITIDQSAMIAGFLMIGNSVTTPLSSSTLLSAKNGIITSMVLMIAGWIVMWQAKDIYWLLGSRFLVGAGHGFGMGQLKYYIRQMCDDQRTTTMINYINLYMLFGIILIFSFGSYVTFEKSSMIAIILSVLILFLTIFLPSTPRELVENKKLKTAKELLVFLKPDVNSDDEIAKIQMNIYSQNSDISLIALLKDANLRGNFIRWTAVIFFQQFTGAPATIIYTQMLLQELSCPYPIYFAILYAIVFFICNFIGIHIAHKYNKKSLLLLSNIAIILILIVQIISLVFNLNETLWTYWSTMLLFLFIIFHTIGLGNVPSTLIKNFFPENCIKVCTHFFMIFFSLLALTITKIFQVLFDQFAIYVPFCLFLAISIVSCGYIAIFIPKKLRTYK